MTSKKRARRKSHKLPGLEVTHGMAQASHVTGVDNQEDEICALDMLELLMDISSILQSMEHYIKCHDCEKEERITVETSTSLPSKGEVPDQRATTPASPLSQAYEEMEVRCSTAFEAELQKGSGTP